jgi:hypothetical protein
MHGAKGLSEGTEEEELSSKGETTCLRSYIFHCYMEGILYMMLLLIVNIINN